MYLLHSHTSIFLAYSLGLAMIHVACRLMGAVRGPRWWCLLNVVLVGAFLIGLAAQFPMSPAWCRYRPYIADSYMLLMVGVVLVAMPGTVGFLVYQLQMWRRRRAGVAAHMPVTQSGQAILSKAPGAEHHQAVESAPPSPPIPEIADNPARRSWLRFVSASAIGMTTGIGVGALLTELKGLQTRRIVLHFPNLPPAFEGYRILQLTDVHSGIYMSASGMKTACEIAAEVSADLVVHTGDQVDCTPNELPPYLEAFGRLRGPDGVLAVLGNHDYWVDGEAVRRGLEQAGIPVLVNRSIRLRRGEQSMVIAGVDDIWAEVYRSAEGPQPTKALAGTAPDDFKIVLAHNPNCFWKCRQAGVDLVLAGHTHGGQVDLYFDGLSPAHMFGQYIRGLYVQEKKQMYVNAGVGYVGLPIRIGVPREIVLFTLMRGEVPPDHV